MKTVAKVFLILGIISIAIGMAVLLGLGLYIGYLFFASQQASAAEEVTGVIIALPIALAFGVGAIVCIVPLVVNIIALRRLNDATSHSELIGPAVCLLVLGINLISGIIMLCMKDEDLA